MISKSNLSLAIVVLTIGCLFHLSMANAETSNFDGPSLKSEEEHDSQLINKLKTLDKWERLRNELRRLKSFQNNKYESIKNYESDEFDPETVEGLKFLKRGLKNVGYGFGRK